MVPTAMTITKRRLLTFPEYLEAREEIIPVSDEEWMQIAEGDLKKDQISRNLVNNDYIRRFAKIKLSKNDRKKERFQQKKLTDAEQSVHQNGEDCGGEFDELELEVVELLDKIRAEFPQTDMNGKENIWILKPTGLSRGRGVTLFSGFSSIINQIKASQNTYVCQKYIENPLLYLGRKMDIRQWCLVLDFDPIEI